MPSKILLEWSNCKEGVRSALMCEESRQRNGLREAVRAELEFEEINTAEHRKLYINSLVFSFGEMIVFPRCREFHLSGDVYLSRGY